MSCDSCLFHKVAGCLKFPSPPRSQTISHPLRHTCLLVFSINCPLKLRKASIPLPHNHLPECCTLLPFVLKTYPPEQYFMEMCKFLFLFDLLFLYQWSSVCDSIAFICGSKFLEKKVLWHVEPSAQLNTNVL